MIVRPALVLPEARFDTDIKEWAEGVCQHERNMSGSDVHSCQCSSCLTCEAIINQSRDEGKKKKEPHHVLDASHEWHQLPVAQHLGTALRDSLPTTRSRPPSRTDGYIQQLYIEMCDVTAAREIWNSGRGVGVDGG